MNCKKIFVVASPTHSSFPKLGNNISGKENIARGSTVVQTVHIGSFIQTKCPVLYTMPQNYLLDTELRQEIQTVSN